MASVYDVKPQFQKLLQPLLAALRSAGVTPNHLTLIALLLSIAVGLAATRAHEDPRWFLLLPLWLLLRMALNALDGMMARQYQMSTPLGAVLNEMGDILSDLALYLPLAFTGSARVWPAVAFGIGALLTECCGLLSQALGRGRRYDGPMGKSDRALVVGAWALLAAFVPAVEKRLPLVLWILAALTVMTCLNRLRHAIAAPSGEPA
jgi:CDP-diacylglycerol--glycerol-3-phosphate 3-phosphatidyltransferase